MQINTPASEVSQDTKGRKNPHNNVSASATIKTITNEQVPEKPKKLGRNDPCWCGSGKKYKKCHMNR